MGLSCTFNTYDNTDDVAWYYRAESELTTLKTKEAKNCTSCSDTIPVGSMCLEYVRWKEILDEFNDPIAEEYLYSYYECEHCNDMRANLEELGYCIELGDNLKVLVKEYAKLNREKYHGNR